MYQEARRALDRSHYYNKTDQSGLERQELENVKDIVNNILSNIR